MKNAKEMREKYEKVLLDKSKEFLSKVKNKVESTIDIIYKTNLNTDRVIIELEEIREVINKSEDKLKIYKKELENLGYRVSIDEDYRGGKLSKLNIIIKW